MKAWEREKKILERLKENGSLSLTQACELTEASVATTRRDFESIREKGLAERTHGGLQTSKQDERRRNYINGTRIEDETDREKMAIAREAAAQVRAGESIFIGAGKTCNMLASLLREVERLNVVTTSVTAVLELAGSPNVSVTLLGGDIHSGKNYIETLDNDVAHTLRGYFFDKVFVTVEGVDLERGYTVQDKSRIPMYNQLARMTRRTYMLLDSGKFDRRAFAVVYPPDKPCRIISTRHMPQKFVQFYTQHGVPCTLLTIE